MYARGETSKNHDSYNNENSESSSKSKPCGPWIRKCYNCGDSFLRLMSALSLGRTSSLIIIIKRIVLIWSLLKKMRTIMMSIKSFLYFLLFCVFVLSKLFCVFVLSILCLPMLLNLCTLSLLCLYYLCVFRCACFFLLALRNFVNASSKMELLYLCDCALTSELILFYFATC